jgi:hypothetical protein
LGKISKSFAICFFLLGTIIANDARSEEELSLSSDSLALKQIQTRVFSTSDTDKILSASVSVFQDLGFIVEDTESQLGLVTASKKSDATNAAQVATAIISFLLILWYPDVDTEQKIYASLVAQPYKENRDKVSVRVTFARKIWDSGGDVSSRQRIESNELYQQFYEKLSKSVFLEAEKL